MKKIKSIEKEFYFAIELEEETEDDPYTHHYRRSHDGRWSYWNYSMEYGNEYINISDKDKLSAELENLFVNWIKDNPIY